MARILQALTRFCLSAWCGAAALFVSVALRPVRTPLFDSEMRAQLANMLFPGYYAAGTGLLLASLLGILFGNWSGIRRLALLALTFCALTCLTVDYFTIYSPLAEMSRQVWMEHAAPSARFRNYHLASMGINSVMLLLCLSAAVVACLSPAPQPKTQTSETA